MSVKRQIELIGVWTRHFHIKKDKMNADERKGYAKRLKELCDEAKKRSIKARI